MVKGMTVKLPILKLLLVLPLASLPLLQGCSDSSNDTDEGFVAELGDISGYASWPRVDLTISDIPGLAGAHMGNDEAFTRAVYLSPGSTPVGGVYPEGSILVKETYHWNPTTGLREFAPEGGLLAMVKRGGDFNPDHAGWEWFMITPDVGSLMARGDNLMDGMCNGCHSVSDLSGGTDYVFAHPVEHVASSASFSNYSSWHLLEESSADHPFINPAHQSDDGNALRRVYRRQLLANPAGGAYPTGTLIVKEVEVGGAIVEITGMAKRGAGFNPAAGDWEWFMLDPAMGGIMDRGANLMGGMCNGCHANATGNHGKDHVFAHAGDPFNN
jgi:mono/diheme cytochrome c family protein